MLESRDFRILQESMDNFVVPTGIGCIPRKIESGFSSFKAEEWKNWILIFSLICFKPVLDSDKYSLWTLFVQACCLFCSRAISGSAIELADRLVHQYCCQFEHEFKRVFA